MVEVQNKVGSLLERKKKEIVYTQSVPKHNFSRSSKRLITFPFPTLKKNLIYFEKLEAQLLVFGFFRSICLLILFFQLPDLHV